MLAQTPALPRVRQAGLQRDGVRAVPLPGDPAADGPLGHPDPESPGIRLQRAASGVQRADAAPAPPCTAREPLYNLWDAPKFSLFLRPSARILPSHTPRILPGNFPQEFRARSGGFPGWSSSNTTPGSRRRQKPAQLPPLATQSNPQTGLSPGNSPPSTGLPPG